MRISDWSSDVCSSDLPGPRRRHARRLAGPRILAALPAVQAAALAGGADHDGCGNTRCEGRPFRLDTRDGSRRGVSRVGRGYAPGAWLACPGRTPLLRLILGCRDRECVVYGKGGSVRVAF